MDLGMCLFLRPSYFQSSILAPSGSWPSRHLPLLLSVCISYLRPLFHLRLKSSSIKFFPYLPYFPTLLFYYPLRPFSPMLHVPLQICHVLPFLCYISYFFMEQVLYFPTWLLLSFNPGYQTIGSKGWILSTASSFFLKKHLSQVRSLQVSLGEGWLLSPSKENGAASAECKDSGQSRNSKVLGSSTQVIKFQFPRSHRFSIKVLTLA